MLAMARANLPQAMAKLWLAAVYAMSAWLLIGPPVIFLLYFSLAFALRRLAAASVLRPKTSEVI
jgi:hypothetical protein